MLALPLSKSLEKIEQAQLASLKRQLNYCANNVPFYQEHFEEHPFNKSAADLHSLLDDLPLVDKATIKSQPLAFRGKNYAGDDVRSSFSSGSTGEPFETYFDELAWLRKKYFVKLRARMACGLSLGEKVAVLECEPEEVLAKQNKPKFLKDLLLTIRTFSVFTPAIDLLEKIRHFAPQNIYAYPSHLLELASEIQSSNFEINGIERIFTSSEFLERGMRTAIENAFSAQVFDHYGSTEFKEIAWECKEHGDYHINNDEVLLEVIKDGKQVFDTPGEIVATDLRNKAMPLLRYRLGDIGVITKKPCACGYSGVSMRPLGGRSSDYLILPSGKTLSPFLFTTEIEKIDGLCHYQIVQQPNMDIVVSTVWNTPENSAGRSSIHQILRELFDALPTGEQISISVDHCDSIANETNGKFKVVKRLIE